MVDKFPLNERTAKFAEDIIELCQSIDATIMNRPIISQLVRSGTSIGANYAEATAGSSKKDFRNKIFICKKEAQETRYWLRMLTKLCGQKEQLLKLIDECQQLILIFQRITSTIDGKSRN
ncbi:MAG: hypothetical protein UX60_C0007G0009 [Berkelbacteria bacterium GW2011_GWA2_46_7]|uniref:Four helix bundle protein n=1 Tax=Berkelbacteria bacterium GW2011_GWA2_46_7 TaxID=1618335 RepID=A0A0G1TG19_9BACT|nr:MAG: hypothetical protein UX60_C0007G0009 [Berkelbacteria bacterium GW2011_GWA2_46_7]